MRPEPSRPQRIKNLSIAGITGLAGCLIIVMVMIALLAGLWLDARAGVRGPFAIGLVVLSVPITLFVVLRIVLRLVRLVEPPRPTPQDTDTFTRGG
jgi:hypothetical protein